MTLNFDVAFDERLYIGWTNTGVGGDLRRHDAHCGVTEMLYFVVTWFRSLHCYLSSLTVDIGCEQTRDWDSYPGPQWSLRNTVQTFPRQSFEIQDMLLSKRWNCRWFETPRCSGDWGCFTNVSRYFQNNLTKKHNTRNHIYGENFKLKLCTCAQSMALGTRTKFQLDIIITSTISEIHKFRENILESSRNVSETPPWFGKKGILPAYKFSW